MRCIYLTLASPSFQLPYRQPHPTHFHNSNPPSGWHTTLNAQHKRALFPRIRHLVRVMRDGAAICRLSRNTKRENHPVGFIRELRVLGGNPWVGAVAEHGVLPELRAGAVGEGEGLVVVVDVGVGVFAWKNVC